MASELNPQLADPCLGTDASPAKLSVMTGATEACLANIRLHPIKSLDPISVPEARVGPSGGLEHDRAWALYTVDNRWVNGKRTPLVLRIRAAFAPDLSRVTLSAPNDSRRIPVRDFAFPDGTENAAEWFSVYFEQKILVRHSRNGFPDDAIANGPTIVSTATLRALCDWFPEIDIEEARRRFRTTLEIEAVDGPPGSSYRMPPFWEDRLFGPAKTYAVRFRIADVNFEGSNPCARCSVPSRDSYTGMDINGFQRRFSDLRRDTLPAWATQAHFDHFYRLAVNTRVARSESGKKLRVGDPIVLL
ncbi:MAG TPA: MOSC N-terminal beta barrel domain-containing protein [Terriglobales bacterium]|nr:MOSC N-terminal beta barrel domain-containing protein [Terriglobales bacterium]